MTNPREQDPGAMYQLEWRSKDVWAAEKHEPPELRTEVGLRRDDVEKTAILLWAEHCVECAAPECHATCSLYVPRGDQICARFYYGVYPNHDFQGLFDYGADVRFRRWAKLWTPFYGVELAPRSHRLLDRFNKSVFDLAGPLERAIIPMPKPLQPKKSPLGGTRRRLLDRIARRPEANAYDEFVIECYSPETELFRLKLSVAEEIEGEERVVFQESFAIEPGWNLHRLSASRFPWPAADSKARGTLWLSVDRDEERRVIFTWLDFVKFKPSRVSEQTNASAAEMAPVAKPADKVKCVAWDLDNTLWHGILVEQGVDTLEPRETALELIRALDERGIIQTVVSKNDHEPAWKVIEGLGLQDYFLYPGINWGAKSANLSQIATRLNINIDTFAVIDDSPFERAEISASLPQVRVYSEEEIPDLLDLAAFDVPITEASRGRRQTYRENMIRETSWEASEESYDEFLRSCELNVRFFVPQTTSEKERCLELVHRTNQLNLSSRRYEADEFHSLFTREGILCLGLECADRFGDYGIVGFACLEDLPEADVLIDFCLSCRVARKRVEHALMHWLAGRAEYKGKRALRARVRETERNGALFRVFEELPFSLISKEGEECLFEMSPSFGNELQDFVIVRDEVSESTD